MKTCIINLLLLAMCSNIYAQNNMFLTTGTIQFEKKINKFAIFKKRFNSKNHDFMQSAYDNYIKTQSQFKTIQSTMIFGPNTSLYQPNTPAYTSNEVVDFTAASQSNTVFTDVLSHSSIAQKNIYGQNYLIKDSLQKINWKITNEVRNIAGYTCRRANAIVMDSIYAVAFYAEEITCSSGPEGFTGLPGMILGVALPSQHITWFATKVSPISISPNDLKPPNKGKPTNNAAFKTTIQNISKKMFVLSPIDILLFLL